MEASSALLDTATLVQIEVDTLINQATPTSTEQPPPMSNEQYVRAQTAFATWQGNHRAVEKLYEAMHTANTEAAQELYPLGLLSTEDIHQAASPKSLAQYQ